MEINSIGWIVVLIFIVVIVVFLVVGNHMSDADKLKRSKPDWKPIPTPPAPPRVKSFDEIMLDIMKSKSTSVNTKLKEIIRHQKNKLFATSYYSPAVLRQIPELVEFQVGGSYFAAYLVIANLEDVGDTPAGLIFKAMRNTNPYLNPHRDLAILQSSKPIRYVLAFSGWVGEGVDGEYDNTINVDIYELLEPAVYRSVMETYIPDGVREGSAYWISEKANEDYANSTINGFNEHVLEKARHKAHVVEMIKLAERAFDSNSQKARQMRANKQKARLPLNSQNGTLKFRSQRLL